MRIIGIDPGSRVTGYGIIACRGSEIGFVTCGTIRMAGEADFSRRLFMIFAGLSRVMDEHRPEAAAVEDLFVAHNPRSALKLGQARGAAVVAACRQRIPVFDYTPRKVKQTVAGYGQAEKGQVQEMVKVLLELSALPSSDAADALAVALCHAHHLCSAASFIK
jgi:crossover junction endodeoxyribonuclease RuvC